MSRRHTTADEIFYLILLKHVTTSSVTEFITRKVQNNNHLHVQFNVETLVDGNRLESMCTNICKRKLIPLNLDNCTTVRKEGLLTHPKVIIRNFLAFNTVVINDYPSNSHQIIQTNGLQGDP